jgi:CRP-like cAMP-binding protein
MVNVFEEYLRHQVQLTAEEWAHLQALSSARHLRKQQFLLHAGQVWQSYAFVCRGCLRQYTIDAKGVEHMLKFSIENWWAGDRESLVTGQPSHQYIDALEDTDVLLFPKDDFDQFAREVPAFHAFIDRLLGRTYLASQRRVQTAISADAETKYREFVQTYPQLALRVPLRMIASYLGLSAETLSRIRGLNAK